MKSKQKGTYAEQIENVTETCKCLVPMIKAGYRMVIGHGNGPQVGMIQNAFAVYHRENADSDVSIYPNPTKGIINVACEFADKIRIFNINGVLVRECNANDDEPVAIDMSEAQDGVYIVQVVHGGHVSMRRFVKE